MSTPNPTELRARAQAFLNDDPDPKTRAELTELLAKDANAELADRFGTRLDFGTAGLRGLLGAGDNRMNRRVVAQTTAGLCAYLVSTVPDAKTRGLCVGYDGRHQSREFANDVCEIAAGAGFVVHAFDNVAPSPLLAFSVLDRGAAAGVMVTASHNPKQYNGYKVYWGNGAQIIPPHDTGIAAAIGGIRSVLRLPRMPEGTARARELLRSMDGVQTRYLAGVRALVATPAQDSKLRIAYTALHGVGEPLARAALAQAGFADVQSVAAQAVPDPEFPTVDFPNPEEKGAMDLVLALARETGAELVLANDPDADRLAAATRNGDGQLITLSGNELGVLLADYLLARAPADGKNLVLSSLVSTPLIARVAKAHDARWESTLTGFKWIANRAIELQRTQGLRFVLGFEEALGYTAGSLVRDKDGVSTAALVACMAQEHLRQGRTLMDALGQLYRTHGLFESRQISITLPGATGLTKITDTMDQLRHAPPKQVADCAVESVLDLERGVRQTGTHSEPATLPTSNVLVLDLAGEHRITIRPSGTEPKIKIYLDVYARMTASEDLSVARARATKLAGELGEAFLTQTRLR